MTNKVVAYVDGACKGNPGPGGWGVYLQYKNVTKELYGGEKNATNNKMELLAAIKCLEALKKPCEIEIYTDSKYVKDGITKWINNWIKNGWKTSTNAPVKNVELWKELYRLSNIHTISWNWVKGHSGNSGNEIADKLANKGIYS